MIPKKGPAIIAPNHISTLDPPLLGFAAKRELFFLAKEELFMISKAFTWLIKTFNAIPLKRKGLDISAFKAIDKLIKRGQLIVIFPEGTRSKIGNFLPFHLGVGFIATRWGIPVIPTFIENTNKDIKSVIFGKNKIRFTFGKPIFPEKRIKEKEYYEKFVNQLKLEIEKLKEGR